MSKDRFDRLEGGGENLPGEVKDAISHLNRFDNLEIGDLKQHPAPIPSREKVLCHHCGQPNEAERDLCWACFKGVKPAPKPAAAPAGELPGQDQEVVIVLDGVTYKAGDKNLPDDVRVLMAKIKKEGYTVKLLEEWKAWRRTGVMPPSWSKEARPSGAPAPAAPVHGQEVEIFKGQRVSVIKIDGKVYTSDDKDLPPNLKKLFDYIDANGVTPALLEHLRKQGSRVKFRPAQTADPSKGEVAFWDEIGRMQGMRPESDDERLRAAVSRLEQMSRRAEKSMSQDQFETTKLHLWQGFWLLIGVGGYLFFSLMGRR